MMKAFSQMWLPVCLLVLANIAFAQTAQVTGTVSDPTGSVMPKAKVAAINLDTGVTRESLTNASGNFIITALLPGRYEVTAEAPGFKQLRRGPFTLAVDQVALVTRYSDVLQVGCPPAMPLK